MFQDLNLVYWSDDFVVVDHAEIRGKCVLKNRLSIDESVESWTRQGEHRFYYESAYDEKRGEFKDLPTGGKNEDTSWPQVS